MQSKTECPARLRLVTAEETRARVAPPVVAPSPHAPRKHLRTIKRAAEALLDDCRDVDLRAAMQGSAGIAMLDTLDQAEMAIAQLRQAAGRMVK